MSEGRRERESMKRFLKFFTGNLGLKLLAAILAFVVYYSMKATIPAGGRAANPSVFDLKGPADGGK